MAKITDDPIYKKLFAEALLAQREAHAANNWSCSATNPRPIVCPEPVENGEVSLIDEEVLMRWGALHEAARAKWAELRAFKMDWFAGFFADHPCRVTA